MVANNPSVQVCEGIKALGEDAWLAVLDRAPEQAAGAPLFARDGHFSGVLLPPVQSRPRALLTFDLLRYFRERSPSFDDDDQNYVKELSSCLHIDLGLSDGVQIQKYGKTRVETGVDDRVPTGEVALNVDFDDIPQGFAYLQTAFFLHRKDTGGVLLCRGKNDFTLRVELTGFNVQPGVTVTATNDGVVICGGNGSAAENAYLWSVSTPLAHSQMPEGHSYHCSQSLFDTVYVVSGETTAKMSGFNLTLQAWQPLSPLPIQRACAGVTAHSSFLYVAGGVGPGATFSDHIFRYQTEANTWDLLPTRLERPVSGPGLKAMNDSEILVFGGQGEAGDKTASFYVRSLTGNKSGHRGEMPGREDFQGCGSTEEEDFLVFSRGRRLFMFVGGKREFVEVKLQEEE